MPARCANGYPRSAEVFAAGDIDYQAFTTIVLRTDLIVDPDVLARVDELVAVNVVRWPSLTRGRLAAKVDAIVARVDADAVRRRKERHADREIWIGADAEGISQISGSLFTVDAHALDKRLNALAATVCAHDPRTKQQRRADALGALAAGADRLGCRCGRADCAAGKRPASSPVTIHVIAEPGHPQRHRTAPASEISADGLITPELRHRTRQVGQTGPAGPPRLRRHPSPATPRPKRWPISCAPAT